MQRKTAVIISKIILPVLVSRVLRNLNSWLTDNWFVFMMLFHIVTVSYDNNLIKLHCNNKVVHDHLIHAILTTNCHDHTRSGSLLNWSYPYYILNSETFNILRWGWIEDWVKQDAWALSWRITQNDLRSLLRILWKESSLWVRSSFLLLRVP